MPQIDPDKPYPFSEACRLIPSNRSSKGIGIATLWRWKAAGVFLAECKVVLGRRRWFIRGSELLKLAATEKVRAPLDPRQARVRTAAQTRRDSEAARKRMAKRSSHYGRIARPA
jgi:hypothetical protein